MKIFVPFAESQLETMLPVGEALIPFQLSFQRGRVTWDSVEVLDESAPKPALETLLAPLAPALSAAD